MKITRIETIPIRVPLKPELAIRSGRGGSHSVSPFLIVKVHTDQDITGLGEVSCTPRWSGEDQFTARHFIESCLAPLLVGEEIENVGRLAATFRLGMAGNHFTKAGVEMALWDAMGKNLGKPVYELLGGKVREFVPTKWSVSGVEPKHAAQIAEWAVEEGFNAMKVKVGLEAEADVARVQAVRSAVGPRIKLGVDANGGWSTDNALRTIERLYEYDIAFVEQPLAPEDLLHLPELKRKLRVPLIADESVYGLQDAMTLAHLKAADVFSIYVGKAGGVGPARKIADFAQASGLKCTVGSNLELGIGSAAMIHLAVATKGIHAEDFYCDIIGPLFYEEDLLEKSAVVIPGQAGPNAEPGLGVELDDRKVERYRTG